MPIFKKLIVPFFLILISIQNFAQNDIDSQYEIITAENASRLEPIQQWNWLGEVNETGRIVAAFSPDGQWFVINQGDKAIRFLKTGTWEEEFALSTGDTIIGQPFIFFSNDGERLLHTDFYCSFVVWGILSRKLIRLEDYGCDTDRQSVAFSVDLKKHAIFDETTSRITMFDMDSAQELISVSTITDSAFYLSSYFAMNDSGDRVALADEDLNIEIWDTQTQERISYLEKDAAASDLMGLGFLPDSNQIWTNWYYWYPSADEPYGTAKLEVWDIHTLENTHTMIEGLGLASVEFYPNSNFAVIGGLGIECQCELIFIRDMTTLENRRVSGGNYLITINTRNNLYADYSGTAETVRMSRVEGGRPVAYLDAPYTHAIEFSPDGYYLYTNSQNGIQIWAVPTLEDTDS